MDPLTFSRERVRSASVGAGLAAAAATPKTTRAATSFILVLQLRRATGDGNELAWHVCVYYLRPASGAARGLPPLSPARA